MCMPACCSDDGKEIFKKVAMGMRQVRNSYYIWNNWQNISSFFLYTIIFIILQEILPRLMAVVQACLSLDLIHSCLH